MSVDIKSKGAFCGAPVKKEISWKHGVESYEATIYVRPLSYQAAVSDIRAINDGSDQIAARIAASICDEDGKAIFTPGDITGEADHDRGPMAGNLTIALLNAIGEVNGMGKAKS